jgi:predicted ester cyclase
MTTTHQTVLAYWTACEARDWATYGALLADDVVYDLPQTRERIHGRDMLIRFNVEYPGEWHLTVDRLIAEDDQAATLTRFTHNGDEMDAQSFFDLDERGLITRITEYWPEPYEPPAGREGLADRY